MSIITKAMKQTCVYWGPPVETGDGDPTWPAAVEIVCRWDLIEGQVEAGTSNVKLENSPVMVPVDCEIGGYLWLGSLSDADADPTEMNDARRITGFVKNPNLRATEFYREAQV